MRASIKINQSDLNELNKKFNFFKDFDKKVLSNELRKTALDIARLAKRTVPVDTSALRNSIEVNSIILEAQKKKIKNKNDLNQIVSKVLKSNQKTILLVIYNSENQRR